MGMAHQPGRGVCDNPPRATAARFAARQSHHDDPIDITRPMKARAFCIAALGMAALTQSALSYAQNINGKNLFTQRCAMCHGADIKGTGPLAKKSNPPTPDLTTAAFKKRLHDYPGVIVSSVILRPNGDLIPRTLRENNVKVPPHTWTVQDFRDLNAYMTGVIAKSR